MKNRNYSIIFVILSLWLSNFIHSSWAYDSDHLHLKDHYIVDVGEIEEETKFDYDEDYYGRTEWYRFRSSSGKDFCFDFIGYVGMIGLSDNMGLLLIGKEKNVKIALMKREIVGGIKIKISKIIVIKCPKMY